MAIDNSKIIAVVDGILGSADRVEVRLDDPRMAEVKDVIANARVRVTLSQPPANIAVHFPGGMGSGVVKFERLRRTSPQTHTAPVQPSPAQNPAKPATPVQPVVEPPKPIARPTHTFVPPKWVNDLRTVLSDAASHVVWLKGPTGSGKSVVARWVANELGMELYQINCHANMGRDSFFGYKTVEIDPVSKQNHIVFRPGTVTKAMTQGLDEQGNVIPGAKPGLLFLDEAAAMPAHIAIALNRVLESDNPVRTITLEDDGGRIVKSHPGFRIILAANTAGRGFSDASAALYTAQGDALDISLINRIAVCFAVGYDREVEQRIALEKMGNDKAAQQLMKIRNAIREAIKGGRLSTPFSTRSIVKIADQFRVFNDLGKAIYFAVYEFLLPEEVAVYNEILHPILGRDLVREHSQSGVDFM